MDEHSLNICPISLSENLKKMICFIAVLFKQFDSIQLIILNNIQAGFELRTLSNSTVGRFTNNRAIKLLRIRLLTIPTYLNLKCIVVKITVIKESEKKEANDKVDKTTKSIIS